MKKEIQFTIDGGAEGGVHKETMFVDSVESFIKNKLHLYYQEGITTKISLKIKPVKGKTKS